MKRRTYRLLVQSEDEPKHLEMVIYGLVALSVIVSIWQFAEQPVQMTRKAMDQSAEVQIAS
jgi:hypothetical protein